MGLLSCFNLRGLARRHGCRRWLETGTALGAGVLHARWTGLFDELHSIEAHAPTHAEACRRLAEVRSQKSEVRGQRAGQPGTGNGEPGTVPQTHLHLGHSPEVLARLLPAWKPGATFFWLDAHFPGADVGAADYQAEADPARKWPLQGELDALAACPAIARDAVILIDDLRIYTGQAWDYGHCRPGPEPDLRRPIGEIPGASRSFPGGETLAPPLNLSAFADTHHGQVWHWMEGYVLLTPNVQVAAPDQKS